MQMVIQLLSVHLYSSPILRPGPYIHVAQLLTVQSLNFDTNLRHMQWTSTDHESYQLSYYIIVCINSVCMGLTLNRKFFFKNRPNITTQYSQIHSLIPSLAVVHTEKLQRATKTHNWVLAMQELHSLSELWQSMKQIHATQFLASTFIQRCSRLDVGYRQYYIKRNQKAPSQNANLDAFQDILSERIVYRFQNLQEEIHTLIKKKKKQQIIIGPLHQFKLEDEKEEELNLINLVDLECQVLRILCQ